MNIATSKIELKVSTPQVLWHGGGNENGKPDPVYSIDFHPLGNIMCTSGIDASIPPKGSVRIWEVGPDDGQECLEDFCDHQSAVNVARFSPNGKMLATASDRQIVVYVLEDASKWRLAHKLDSVKRIWLRPSLSEIFDVQWSIDSTHIVIGSIDSKGEIINITSRASLLLGGHVNYVQGVAWDPLNKMVLTQSADRSCKAHQLKWRESANGRSVKLAARGHASIKMHSIHQSSLDQSTDQQNTAPLTAADFGMDVSDNNGNISEGRRASNAVNLFADAAYVPSFFRRLCFTPDGKYLLAPTGIYRPPSTDNTGAARKQQQAAVCDDDRQSAFSISGVAHRNMSKNSYCTHIFARNHLSSPCASLIGLDEPSVAVRCCPRPLELYPTVAGMMEKKAGSDERTPAKKPSDLSSSSSSSSGSSNIPTTSSAAHEADADAHEELDSDPALVKHAALPALLPGKLRFLFAVATIHSVMIYDTQHPAPLARINGQHYAAINDVAWAADGRMLAVCSSDGYVTFVRLPEHWCGSMLSDDLVPEAIKRAHPSMFNFIEPDEALLPNAVPTLPAASLESRTVEAAAVRVASASVGTTASLPDTSAGHRDGKQSSTTAFVPAAATANIDADVATDVATDVTADKSEATKECSKATAGVPADEGVETTAAAAITNDSSSSSIQGETNKKKKKRIQPVMIAALTNGAGSGGSSSSSNDKENIAVADNSSLLETAANSPQLVAPGLLSDSGRKKRRITPVLYATYTTANAAVAVAAEAAETGSGAALSAAGGHRTHSAQ